MAEDEIPRLSMGPGTLQIPPDLYAQNRRRLVQRLHSITTTPSNSVIILQGGDEIPFYDTDVTYNVFRQESYFRWAFGVVEPGCFGAIVVDTGNTHLFVPHFSEKDEIWRGPLRPLDYFITKYGLNHVHYIEEIVAVLEKLYPSTLLTLYGVNSDSGLHSKEATFPGIEKFKVNNTLLFNEIADLRVIKTDLEIEVLKYVTGIASGAHRRVMRFARPGRCEYQCEAKFMYHCYNVGGCRHIPYTCSCASDANSAILQYGHAAAPNDRILNDGALCVFDMGASYFGYASDITCTFPIGGKFSPDQKLIYEIVLAANQAVMNAVKPGVSWSLMHVLALRTILAGLRTGGLLKGDVDDMIKAGLGAVFQPHGIGHLIGLDVHDVGGYLPKQPPRLSFPKGLDKLRTNRMLQEGMVITIEPGCYFIDILLNKALTDQVLTKFLVPEVIERFRGFGGVRIEDDVVVTKQGVINMSARIPRTVQEIEDWMAGRDSDKY